MARSLTAADLASFARNGYLCPLPGLSEGEAAATLAALEEFERRHDGFGKLLRFKAHLRLAALMAVARDERILDAVEDLIGPDILLFTSTLWPKDGKDGRFVSWHQDSAYFGLTPHEEVTAWVAFTRSDRENGCVRVMPGSHLGVDYSHDETHEPDNLLIRGQTGLHVRGAAPVDLAVGDRAAERRHRPARGIADRKGVEMAVDDQPSPRFVSGEPGDQIDGGRPGGDETRLDIRRITEQTLDRGGERAGITWRVLTVDPDEGGAQFGQPIAAAAHLFLESGARRGHDGVLAAVGSWSRYCWKVERIKASISGSSSQRGAGSGSQCP